MAKKQETVSMIDSLQEFKDLKNIDKETMINVLEESFRNVIAKMFGTDENYDVIINPEKGDFEIWRNRTVVENGHVSDPNLEVSLRDDLCHDGELLQQAGGLRPRHDDPRERVVMCDGVSWAG